MSNFWTILWHTYWTKIKTKSFLITTIITALLFVLLANITTIIDAFSNEETPKVAVIDETNSSIQAIERIEAYTSEEVILESVQQSEAEVDEKVISGEFTGALYLTSNGENLISGEYKSLSIADTTISSLLQTALQQIKTELTAESINLSPEQLQTLYAPVSFETTALEENAKSQEELSQARGLVYVVLFLIYFAVIMYASMIANEVATEKSSRIMEILISSTPPVQQMFAKILGIALLSVTQMLILGSIGFIALRESMSKLEGGWFEAFGFSNLSLGILFYAAIFFLLGYFLYATLAAFLGSLVSRIEDVQQMIMPMTMLVVVGFLLSMYGLSNPDTTFITIASYIPFFTPMLMFLRVGMLSLPVWEPILGMAVLIVTTIILAIFGARVYRGGVLMYGRSSSYKDIKKAIQLTKKEK
ncbi:ABC transporter permease [Cytobacillus sp. FSL R5-0569]|uniref:ABC transporter permease n=1 Tax=Cytobacillus TaxID=2675230 RepID=UPI00277FC484|nr:ABC transporter permease [Cytobacillus kochii]MDQ0187458.1 ABC-2 type transport system permease protein [Cytobacillus kochii]